MNYLNGQFDVEGQPVVSIDRFWFMTRVVTDRAVRWLWINRATHTALVRRFTDKLERGRVGYVFDMEQAKVFSIERTLTGTVVGYYSDDGAVREWMLPLTVEQHNELCARYGRGP